MKKIKETDTTVSYKTKDGLICEVTVEGTTVKMIKYSFKPGETENPEDYKWDIVDFSKIKTCEKE